jgi:hypothetical protein
MVKPQPPPILSSQDGAENCMWTDFLSGGLGFTGDGFPVFNTPQHLMWIYREEDKSYWKEGFSSNHYSGTFFCGGRTLKSIWKMAKRVRYCMYILRFFTCFCRGIEERW